MPFWVGLSMPLPQGNPRSAKPVSGEGGLPPTAGDQDSRWKQYLEDERIALFLQNEEFMKELQRNRDFLLALERGSHCPRAGEGRMWASAALAYC